MSFGDNPYGQNYATGGGVGGGFMAGSQGDSPSGRGTSAKQTLRPLTIRQIRNAEQPHPDADFRVDGQDIGQVTVVAIVRAISKGTTNVSYSVEDGTDTIEVRQWHDSSAEETTAEIQVNQYVRILGTIRTFQSKRSISAGHMRRVDSYNEVLYHKLEAVIVHLQLIQGKGAAAASGAGAGQGAGSNDLSAAAGHDFSSISSPVQRKIAQAVAILTTSDSEGVTASDVHSKLPSVPISTISKEIEEMVNNGFLYHSVDDEHVLLP
ncbi:unnamed protein product [Jaminaea pallidilutea]